ncbi:MAG: radical SAM protein [Pseudomonadota bacterium]
MPGRLAEENKLLNDAERNQQLKVLKSFPQRVVFETTNRCNLRCQMCGQSHRNFVGNDLPMEVFKKTEKLWDKVFDVSLFGWGEPLLNKNLIIYFDLIRKLDPRIFILTNGTLLTHEISLSLIEGKLDYLNFSIDGATPDTYKKIRRGADFEEVINNIKVFVDLKNKSRMNFPYLRSVFVGMRQNIKELPDFVRLSARLGMDEAKMVYMIAYGESMEDQVLFYHKEMTNSILDEAKKVAVQEGIKLNLPDSFDLDLNSNDKKKGLKHKLCFRPWEEMFVQSDGKVRLCMLSNEIIGDLKTDDIDAIWNNDKYQFFRETVNGKKPEGTCSSCPQYSEMNVNDIRAFIQTDTQLPTSIKR